MSTAAQSVLPSPEEPEQISELSRLALAQYETELKTILEPGQNGRGLAIHPATGDYLVAQTPTQAGHEMRKKHPDGGFVTMKIGPLVDYALSERFLAGQQKMR